MWIRRIHLFTGLFMLPWVLLYGFTALLFNHSTWFSDSRIENVALSAEEQIGLPVSDEIAQRVIADLRDEGIDVELADSPRALFTRSAFVSYETEDSNTTLVLDLNSGNGYRRIREKPAEEESTDQKESGDENKTKPRDLAKGVPVSVDPQQSLDVTELVKELGDEIAADQQIKLTAIPTLEFDAIVDGQPKRLRFSQQSNRRRGGSLPPQSSKSEAKNKTDVTGTVVAVGENPRQMSWRSYLLRLHMAHGYPNTKNARYWWAYAVDAMFLCMVFWGFSGVFMWWQIKRTRVIGFVLLFASGVIAAYLAFAMHWQLVNG